LLSRNINSAVWSLLRSKTFNAFRLWNMALVWEVCAELLIMRIARFCSLKMLSNLEVFVEVHGQTESSRVKSVVAHAMLLYVMYGRISVLYNVMSMCLGRV